MYRDSGGVCLGNLISGFFTSLHKAASLPAKPRYIKQTFDRDPFIPGLSLHMAACSEISEVLFQIWQRTYSVDVRHPYASQNVRKSGAFYFKSSHLSLHFYFCHGVFFFLVFFWCKHTQSLQKKIKTGLSCKTFREQFNCLCNWMTLAIFMLIEL